MKVEIKKKDYFRVLLTDTLPYELPILCSNEGIYKILKSKKTFPEEFKHIFHKEQVTIPFSYKIKKDSSNSRTLSIPHISNQIRSCEFYEKYEHIILHLCSRSSLSLRYPNRIGSHFYEKNFLRNRINLKDGDINVIKNGFDEQNITSSSHFSYKKYNFVYKFYDSYEFHRLERKYNKLMKLDISKFFSHIYTHSISWAVKSKRYAKTNRENSHFEGMIDKLFQDSNYGETNGIIIGPEFSRIYSEIILQRIDCNITDKLKENFGRSNEQDYSIRRYVDDYFIFSNSDEVLREVEVILSSELEDYKLYLNESKRTLIERPFISGATMAKIDIKDAIDKIYHSLINDESMREIDLTILGKSIIVQEDNHTLFPLKKIKNKKYEADKFIKSIKAIIKKNNISFESISSYLLSALKSKFFNVIRKLSLFKITTKKEETYKFFSIIFEVIFFIYSMDSRVRQTYIVSQIILEIASFTKNQDNESQEIIKKNLFDEVVLSIKSLGEIKNRQVEFSNLLICLNSLGEQFKLSSQNLLSIINKDQATFNLDYFCICSLIFYIKNDRGYSHIKKEILARVKIKFALSPDLKIDSEASLLIMDLICCPYLDEKEKRSLVKEYLSKAKIKNIRTSQTNEEIRKLVEHYNCVQFFFDWNGEANLEEILYKKELRSPYE